MRHLVISAPQLEAEDGLRVLSLEENIAFESVAEVDGWGEGRYFAGFVDSGRGAGNHAKILSTENN
jgi:hypothetical protein